LTMISKSKSPQVNSLATTPESLPPKLPLNRSMFHSLWSTAPASTPAPTVHQTSGSASTPVRAAKHVGRAAHLPYHQRVRLSRVETRTGHCSSRLASRARISARAGAAVHCHPQSQTALLVTASPARTSVTRLSRKLSAIYKTSITLQVGRVIRTTPRNVAASRLTRLSAHQA
jgi:hypothetical protein